MLILSKHIINEHFVVLNLGIDEIERLHIVEKIALENYQNGTTRARSRYNDRNMMTDER